MASPHHPKRYRSGQAEPCIPTWAADRMMELRQQRWTAPPWVREEIDKQIERLKKMRKHDPEP